MVNAQTGQSCSAQSRGSKAIDAQVLCGRQILEFEDQDAAARA
jgi:hypothetical protein